MSGLARSGHTDFRSLFRSLLREASYLPDGPSRVYAKKRIVSGFRTFDPRRTESANVREKRRPRLKNENLRRSLLRDGNRALRQLQRANMGYNDDLLNVLLSTYGRKDERRWELLKPFIGGDKVQDNKSDVVSKQISKLPNFPRHISEELPRPDPRLLTLLRHQKAADVRWPASAKVKNMKLEVPAQNSWLRPTPVKRVVNIVRRWYKDRLEQVLPPLPSAEWSRLENLVKGKEKWDGPVKRRTPAQSYFFSRRTVDDWMTNTIPAPCRPSGMNKLQDKGGKEQPHAITARYMQRIYAKILQISADMKWDDMNKSWTFKWGQATPRRTRLPKNLRNLKP